MIRVHKHLCHPETATDASPNPGLPDPALNTSSNSETELPNPLPARDPPKKLPLLMSRRDLLLRLNRQSLLPFGPLPNRQILVLLPNHRILLLLLIRPCLRIRT